MRDSRRLAFILAALAGSVPFTAFAQTTGAQQGREGLLARQAQQPGQHGEGRDQPGRAHQLGPLPAALDLLRAHL